MYQSLTWLRDNKNSETLDLTFAITEERNGRNVTIELIPNGSQVAVNDRNKDRYIKLMVSRLTEGKVSRQAELVRQGLEAVVSREILDIFNEREFALLICGAPNFDVEDWRSNTTVSNADPDGPILTWFWSLVGSLSQEERGLLFRFCTGSSRLPPVGFSDLTPKFTITLIVFDQKKALPTAATCFNNLKLPM